MGNGEATGSAVADKLMWTLVAPDGTSRGDFKRYVLKELAVAAGQLVSGATSVRLTLQEAHAFCGALVRVGDTDRRIDAVLQITSSLPYVATDPVNSVLDGSCGHVQGWRVHPTAIFDASPTVPHGTPLPSKQMLWINQRIDGTTPEFYNRNWYIHAGHLDGLEAESDESSAIRVRSETDRFNGRWYYQNRVVEPITPTAWVVNGFADLLADEFVPGPGERYDPKKGMGEESFDRWPPRVIQGSSYRVL
jgi:hypothetical protein